MTVIRARGVLKWLSAAVLAAAFLGWAYFQHLDGNIRHGQLDIGTQPRVPAPTPNAAGQTPLNVLVIGTDSRNSADAGRLGGARDDAGRPGLADVEMLVHVSADHGPTLPTASRARTAKQYE